MGLAYLILDQPKVQNPTPSNIYPFRKQTVFWDVSSRPSPKKTVTSFVLRPLLGRHAQVDQSKPLHEVFGAMPWTTCAEAELSEVIQYLKKSQWMIIPKEWGPFF